MLDPKILLIRHRVGRLAKKLVDRSSVVSSDVVSKKMAIEALEASFGIHMTESQVACALLVYHGCFPQLATGEGKTFSIGLASAWLALEGKDVHVVAPNEYLSKRDCDQLRPFFKGLKLTVAWIGSEIPEDERLPLYRHNIVYTTPSVIAFDQMRERSKIRMSDKFQYISDNSHLIIDEADAVLIENGSVPFIFAQNIESDHRFWEKSSNWLKDLSDSDFSYDSQTESTYLSNDGYEKFEQFMAQEGFVRKGSEVYTARNSGFFHKITMVVRAIKDFSENTDYMVVDNEIIILNQSTGRAEKDRQWGQGLHQAIEAKHGLTPSCESEVVSKITVPEIVSLYSNFSGTSATILHAQDEIFKRYGRLTLDVKRAHKDQRRFLRDQCFDSKDLKRDVIARDVKSAVTRGQPVLIGVESIEEALDMHSTLLERDIMPALLTAKNEPSEADIIAEAGVPGAVTIATNMAGRGTDIKLGGSRESGRNDALRAGGLHVIGASRQSERRLDDQLSGRCGRQGDPGSVQFYVSLGDKLLKDQDKITSIRKISEKSLALLQKSKANKISVSRDEIDAYNDVFLIHRDIFYDLRSFWSHRDDKDIFDELVNLFVVNLRHELQEYGVDKSGVYKDFEGFNDRLRTLTGGFLPSMKDLNEHYVGPDLCARIEKKALENICYNIKSETLYLLRENTLKLFDDMWCDHQILLEQIYDHAKWQALIQKNERIQFAIFGYDAMESFVGRLEQNLLTVLFEGIE